MNGSQNEREPPRLGSRAGEEAPGLAFPSRHCHGGNRTFDSLHTLPLNTWSRFKVLGPYAHLSNGGLTCSPPLPSSTNKEKLAPFDPRVGDEEMHADPPKPHAVGAFLEGKTESSQEAVSTRGWVLNSHQPANIH